MKTKLICCTLVFLFLAAQTYGWGSRGHMLIASIAYSKMDEIQRQSVTDILRSHPDYPKWSKEFKNWKNHMDEGMYLMMRASVWPDEIRSADNPNSKFHRPEWHYITYTIEFPSPKADLAATPTPNVVAIIPMMIRNVGNTDSEAQVRAMYLAWLIHLTGDIHQPLHCGSLKNADYKKGDRGGNSSFVNNGEPTNLHSLWDKSPGTGSNLVDIMNQAKQIIDSNPQTPPESFDPERTSLESYKLAVTVVHRNGKLKGSKSKESAPALPENYITEMKATTFKRIAEGGNALAFILNNIPVFFDQEELVDEE